MPRFYRGIGLVCLLIPLVWNVWLVEAFFSANHEPSNYTKGWIWISDVGLLATGFLIIKYQRKAVLNIVLVMASVTVGLGLFELILRTGLLDNVSDPHPVWVPEKYEGRSRDEASYAANVERILSNPLQFNDIPRSTTKPKGYRRIAVLGDSFIQGWNLQYDEIWSHRLEHRVQGQFQNIEVLSWGKSGWETIDEFRFLKEQGIHYGIDLLLVGFVINDPNLGDIPSKHLIWQHTTPMRPMRVLFPNVLQYVSRYINLLISRYILTDYGHETAHLETYSNDNLKQYGKLLKEFSDYCASHHIRLLFVLTPNDYDSSNRQLFDKVIPLLRNANIDYLDLYPAVYERLHTYPQRQLWLTPGDAHPGPLVTDVYADEMFRYLRENGILDNLPASASAKS